MSVGAFKPHRGKSSSAQSKELVLEKGELFFEVPEAGEGPEGTAPPVPLTEKENLSNEDENADGPCRGGNDRMVRRRRSVLRRRLDAPFAALPGRERVSGGGTLPRQLV